MRAGPDLDAPLLPDEAAGGCHIGQSIDELRAWAGEWLRIEPVLDYRHQPAGLTRYRSEALDLWVTSEGRISQIGVHGPYRGTLFGRIRLGMTIDDIERLVGPCAEDSEDNLIIRGVRGLAFDVEWHPDHFIAEDIDFQLTELRCSPLTWFFIFAEDEADPWGSVTIARIPSRWP
jgi:hypothetical protein